MEHESFEDPEVGRLMNETFVSIKVDREERPDIDGLYMKVSQMLTGRGGWPLNIIMTPDKKPFFAATYIPKEGRYNMMGLIDLIGRVQDLWEHDRDRLLESAETVARELAPYTEGFVSVNGKATVFVCSNYQCELPTNDPARMEGLLDSPKHPWQEK